VTTRSPPVRHQYCEAQSIRKSAATVSTELADERCSSGVEDWIDILGGGFAARRLLFNSRDPGSGKTTLGASVSSRGTTAWREGLYITLSETREELLKVRDRTGGRSIKSPVLDVSAVEDLLRPEAQTTVFHPSEVELTKASQLLLDEVPQGAASTSRLRFAVRIPINGRNRFTLPAPTSDAQTAIRKIREHRFFCLTIEWTRQG